MTRDNGSRPKGRDANAARGGARQSGREAASPELTGSLARTAYTNMGGTDV
jgi:hypothetical protein